MIKQARETVDIERLVTWALVDQGLGWSLYGDGGGLDGFAELGTRIDSSGIGAPTPALQDDDDALVVRDAILALDADIGEMIIRYGRTGTRPDWCEDGPGHWRQKRARNGRLAWHFAKAGDRRSERTPVMEFVGDTEDDVAWWRGEYRKWRDALAALVDVVNAGMKSREAVGPGVAREPWQMPVGRILTPDGPLERRRRSESRVGPEFVEIDGKWVRRDHVHDRA